MYSHLNLNYPKYWICLTIFLVLFSLGTFAQGDDKRDFEKVFEQELSEETSQLRKEQFSMGVSELPVWFWNLPVATDKLSYAIGISDPEMEDKHKATNQAFYRALMQFNLMNETKLSGISDLYNKDVQNKYEEIFRFLGNSKIQGNCLITDSFQTKFGETVLLVNLDKTSNKTMHLQTDIQTYKSYSKVEIGWCNSEQTNCVVKNDSIFFYYEYLQADDCCAISSVYNNDTIQIPAYQYVYRAEGANVIDSSTVTDTTIQLYRKGLWLGYLQSFINNLQMLTANLYSRLKAMNELYKDSSGRDNTNSIMRNIVNDSITFSIKRIRPVYRQINMDFNVNSNKFYLKNY